MATPLINQFKKENNFQQFQYQIARNRFKAQKDTIEIVSKIEKSKIQSKIKIHNFVIELVR